MSSIAAVAGTGDITATSTLEFAGAASTNVTFAAGSTGVLQLDSSALYSGTITGFTGAGTGAPATSDKLDLRDINFTSATFSKSYQNNVLTVSDGTQTANITFIGSYTLANFTFANDGSNGTLITDPPTTDPGIASGAVAAKTDPVAVADDTTVELASAYSGQATFNGPLETGILQIDHAADFSGTVAGMLGQDALDLRDIDFSDIQKPVFSGNDSSGTLSISDDLHTANIQLLGNYMAAAFAMSSDGHGGTSIEIQPHPVTMLTTSQHA